MQRREWERKEIPIISQLAQKKLHFTRTALRTVLHLISSRPSVVAREDSSVQHERNRVSERERTKVRNILQIFILVSDRCLISKRVEGVLKNKVSSSLLQNNSTHSKENRVKSPEIFFARCFSRETLENSLRIMVLSAVHHLRLLLTCECSFHSNLKKIRSRRSEREWTRTPECVWNA